MTARLNRAKRAEPDLQWTAEIEICRDGSPNYIGPVCGIQEQKRILADAIESWLQHMGKIGATIPMSIYFNVPETTIRLGK